MATGSKSSRITPADGLLRFTSAMTRMASGCRSSTTLRKKFRGRPSSEIRSFSSGSGTRRFDSATSRRLCSTMCLRTGTMAFVAAISCLTDAEFFGGDLSYIHAIRDAVPLPVLRKDFIIDDYQVWEARAAGADAILLIAECLHEREIIDFQILATELQMTTILEVHGLEHLWRVVNHVGFPHAGYGMLGINNRDLATMRTDLGHALRIADMVEAPTRRVMAAAGGIGAPEDMRRLRAHGIHIAIVGERLLREPDPGAALRTLLSA
jgi:indole-3-glycerol phosphate synthase